jgi:surface polysaccharide O-acyltransferase-like enzyme
MGKDMDLIHTGIQSLFKPIAPHLWYMYPFIGLLIALPFTSAMIKSMDPALEVYFIKLWMFFSGIVLILRMIFDLVGVATAINYNVPIVQGTYYLGYFIAGHILMKRIKNSVDAKRGFMVWGLAYAGSIGAMWLGTFYLSVKKGSYYDWIYTYRSIFTIIATLSLFACIGALCDPMKIKAKKVLDNLSRASFGVYLIHMIPWEFIRTNIDVLEINGFIGVPLFTGIVFIISYLIVSVIQLVPVLNKIV